MHTAILAIVAVTPLVVLGCYFKLHRMLRRIMSQDDDLTAAIDRLTADTSQEIQDITAALKPAQADPVVAAAISRLTDLDSNVQAADANIKAIINPPAPPASGTGVPSGTGTVTPTS